MVAGALALLGVPMSSVRYEFDEYNAEDLEIVAASQGRTIIPISDTKAYLSEPAGTDFGARTARLGEIVADRNARHKIWGFKDPSSYMYLNDIRNYLINPRFVLIYRDFFAIAEKEFSLNDYPIEDGLREVFRRYSCIQDIILSWRIPTLVTSYERATTDRREFIDLLSAFVGIEIGPLMMSNILAYISPDGGYKRLQNYRTPEIVARSPWWRRWR